jgi:hypothetical protein
VSGQYVDALPEPTAVHKSCLETRPDTLVWGQENTPGFVLTSAEPGGLIYTHAGRMDADAAEHLALNLLAAVQKARQNS